jgi:quinol-cytochrome oxidoreductase complex cytochrome b subunit
MPVPNGSVAALSSASATIFSIGIAFLGYWGMYDPTKWRAIDVIVFVVALAGFVCLRLVPWLATSPVESESDDSRVRIARHLFIAGVGALWLAVALSVVF